MVGPSETLWVHSEACGKIQYKYSQNIEASLVYSPYSAIIERNMLRIFTLFFVEQSTLLKAVYIKK